MNKYFLINLFIFLICICVFPPHSNAFNSISGWSKVENFPESFASNSLISIDNKLYVIGGANFNTFPNNYYWKVDLNGALTDLNTYTKIESNLFWLSSVKTNSYVYILGGATYSPVTYSNKVYKSAIGADFSWSETSDLPQNIALGGGVISGDYVYFAGGHINNSDDVSKSVYFSHINSDGSLDGWQETTELPRPFYGFTLINHGDYLYVVGVQDSRQTYRAKINSDGTIGPWVSQELLPTIVYRAAVVKVDNVIYSIGGLLSANSITDQIYYSTIGANGDLGPWQTSVVPFPKGNCCVPGAVARGRIYVAGGHSLNNYSNEVWMTNELVDPNITPTIAPSPTPSPTPTLAPIPVTKVVLIPGMGGSWNSDAILNCKTTNISGPWTMSPLANFVYNPLINKIKSIGKTPIPFYYDWRRQVTDSADTLNEFINNNTSGLEKIDIVGHSEGGLVLRAYMQKYGLDKINKPIFSGTPQKGLVSAYPAWSGGDIVHVNPIYQAAQMIAVRRCGGLESTQKQLIQANIPVVQNMLPIFDYLLPKGQQNFTQWSSQAAKNNWLPNTIDWDNFSVYSIVGNGKQTLASIETKPRSAFDVLLGNWEDGKPTKYVKNSLGDGAVIYDSAKILGKDNVIINTDHLGVINSPAAIDVIINIIKGNPTLVTNFSSTSTSPKSMLVVISNDVQIDDPLAENSNGISVLVDPKNKNYQLRKNKANKKNTYSVLKITEDKSDWTDFKY